MNLITYFLKLQNQLQVLHWQTESYARHMAYGATYDALGDLIDGFIEIYQGKYGRITLDERNIELKNISEDVNDFVSNAIEVLLNDMPQMLDVERDTDLLNIRDEVLAELNKLKYLLTLK